MNYAQVGLVYTNGYVIDENNNIKYPLFTENHREENEVGRILLDCYIRTPSSIMVKKKLLYNIGLFEESLHSMDHDILIKLNEVTKFKFVSEKLTYYRRHGKQKSRSRKQWEDGFRILRAARKRYSYPRYLLLKRKAVLYYRLGMFDINHRRWLKGLIYLFLSMCYDPKRSLSEMSQRAKPFLRKMWQ